MSNEGTGRTAEQEIERLNKLLSISEDAYASLETDLDAEEKRSEMHADINRRSAAALGKPPDGEGSRWGDIPECIAALVDALAESKKMLAIHGRHSCARRLYDPDIADKHGIKCTCGLAASLAGDGAKVGSDD